MISWQRQQTLGFDMTTDILDNIVLTFPDDRKATMFRLKYGEYLEPADNPISNSFSIV